MRARMPILNRVVRQKQVRRNLMHVALGVADRKTKPCTVPEMASDTPSGREDLGNC